MLNMARLEQGELRDELIAALFEEPQPTSSSIDQTAELETDPLYQEAQVKRRRIIEDYLDSLSPLSVSTAGGNTPCIEIRVDDDLFIIDAGSGIRELGLELMKTEFGSGKGVLHLLFSHPHWDHIQGFPFFRPAFVPGNKIFIYGVHDMETALRRQQDVPSFPVSLDYMQADIEFRPLQPDKALEFGDLRIRNIRNHHPGDAYSFRFERGEKVFVYASDSAYPAGVDLRHYLNFFADADVLIYDAQFTLKESDEKEDWGHSSALVGLEMAQQAKVKTLVLYHYDPTYSDEQLKEILENTLIFQRSQYPDQEPVDVVVAQEGQTFNLTSVDHLQLQQVPGGKAAILQPRGIFDERIVAELREQLDAIKKQDWPPQLIVDMSEVDMLQVAGLRALVKFRRAEPGLTMVLAGPSISVQQVIELAGYLDFFAIYPSVHTALKRFQTRKTLDLPGQMIKNRYYIETKIGDGRLGTVYKAVDTRLNQSVAIKVLSPSFSEGAIEQFLQQARQIVDLIHPNIVDVYDCDEDRGLSFMAEEFIESDTLRELIETHPGRPLPFDQALHIAENIAEALEYAHAHGVIHGDLKPKNVLLGDEVKISDFGLGRLESGKSLINLDVPLALVSAHYLAPEQILGHPIDDRTDLYALGVILYELFTGRRPFEGADDEVLEQHRHSLPRSPRKLNPTLPHSLEHLILKLLDKDPNKRYASARQVRRILGSMVTTASSQIKARTFTRQQWPPLVEREKILLHLVSLWEKTRQGQGQLVFIAGEAGVGKTRLIRELAHRVGQATLLMGRCERIEHSRAYQPFIEALRTYFARVSVPVGPASDISDQIVNSPVGQVLAQVARFVPELQTLLPYIFRSQHLEPGQAFESQDLSAGRSKNPGEAPAETPGPALVSPIRVPQEIRDMKSMRLVKLIAQATSEEPWLLILDDLHLADQSSLKLLEYLAYHCAEVGLMIVGLYRENELENNEPLKELLENLDQEIDLASLALEPLTDAGVKRLLHSIWSPAVPPDLVAAIYRRTEGNPFYIEEIIKGLIDEDVVTRRNGQWRFSSVVESGLPQRIQDAVLRRTDRLARKTQTLLNQATILGSTFKFADLHEMSDLSEWEVLESLDVALERQLINQMPTEDTLRFSYGGIQEILYKSLSPLKRRVIHLEAGEALLRRHAPELKPVIEALAYHFAEAGERERALSYCIEAGTQAVATYSHQNALFWYSQALEILAQLDANKATQPQRFDLLLARERIYSDQGRRQAQVEDLDMLHSLAEIMGDAAKTALVHNRRAAFERAIGQFDRATMAAETGLSAAREANRPLIEVESLLILGQIAADRGQFQAALEQFQSAQDFLREVGHLGSETEAHCLVELSVINRQLNDLAPAESSCQHALGLFQALGIRQGQASCLSTVGALRLDNGAFSEAITYFGQALEINRMIRYRPGEADSLNMLARLYKEVGQYKRAQKLVEKAQHIHHQMDDLLGEANDLRTLATIQLAGGDYVAARDYAGEALEISQHLGARAGEGATWLELGLAQEMLNALDKAEVAYNEARKIYQEIGNEIGVLETEAGLARCLLARGQTDEAQQKISAFLPKITSEELANLKYPVRIYLTAYWVFQATNNKKKALAALQSGQTLLQERIEGIADPELQASYKDKVPENKELWTQLKLQTEKD